MCQLLFILKQKRQERSDNERLTREHKMAKKIPEAKSKTLSEG